MTNLKLCLLLILALSLTNYTFASNGSMNHKTDDSKKKTENDSSLFGKIRLLGAVGVGNVSYNDLKSTNNYDKNLFTYGLIAQLLLGFGNKGKAAEDGGFGLELGYRHLASFTHKSDSRFNASYNLFHFGFFIEYYFFSNFYGQALLGIAVFNNNHGSLAKQDYSIDASLILSLTLGYDIPLSDHLFIPIQVKTDFNNNVDKDKAGGFISGLFTTGIGFTF